MWYRNTVELTELVGKEIAEIDGLEKDSEQVEIKTACGQVYAFLHFQDCCESVRLGDFEADSDNYAGAVITSAEEVNGEDGPKPEYVDSLTWSFYKIETTKGGIWMRWLGESNGYYGEEVDFVWKNKPQAT